jgi:hypothetical protein
MFDTLSVYREGQRVGQTPPIPDVLDVAYADGKLIALTGRGLVMVSESGAMSPPDRPPALDRLRLLGGPDGLTCLMVGPVGDSFVIDRAGTYPRGRRLPHGSQSLAAANGVFRILAAQSSGCSYWRDDRKLREWPEATSAVMSHDGRKLVIVLPEAIEVWEDDG